jgi:hypothetical protein
VPDQPPELRQLVLHVWACVAQTWLWQDLLFLNEVPSLQLQSKGVHSLPEVHASPGFFGPGGPASGTLTLLPDQPPRLPHSAGHCPLAGPHLPFEHAAAVAGVVPSLHAQTSGAQSSDDPQPAQPPWLAHALGQASSGAGEQ